MSLVTASEEEQLESALRQAGERLMAYWPGNTQKSSNELGVKQKADGSVVTKADFESNEIIISALRRLFPSDGILSEELPPPSDLSSLKRLWIIDPLDGTQTFVNGNDDFSILVALCVGPTPKFGFMYFPARNHLAVAREDAGAFLNGKRLQVSKSRVARDQRVYVRNMGETKDPLAYPRWMDSGCALLQLGSGEFDGIVIRLLTHREWDLAAPAVMIQEAGGLVSDEFGKPISFNQGGMQCRFFIGSNGIVHQQLLEFASKHNS